MKHLLWAALCILLAGQMSQASVVATSVIPGDKYSKGHEPKVNFILSGGDATELYKAMTVPEHSYSVEFSPLVSFYRKDVALYSGNLKISCTRTPYRLGGYALWNSDTCVIQTKITGAYDDLELAKDDKTGTVVSETLIDWGGNSIILPYLNAFKMHVNATHIETSGENVADASLDIGKDLSIACRASSRDSGSTSLCAVELRGNIRK